MRKFVVGLIFLLSMLPLCVGANNYLLCPGDVVTINIISSADIAGSFGTASHGGGTNGLGFGGIALNDVMIRPDGKLSIPLVGEITVEGLTPTAVSALITERLHAYLVEPPSVTVNLVKIHTTRVYVLGEVNHPGLFELERSNNLVDALSMAGGWTKEAAKKKVFIIRKNMQGTPVKVNLLDVLEKGDTSKNLALEYGDIVYLSSNGRIDFVRDIAPFIGTIYQIRHW